MNLSGKNILVFDAEIKNTIDGKNVKWTDFDKMGVSVACAFDYRDMRFRVFMDDNLDQLVNRLNEPKTLIVFFNGVHFDIPLIRATPNKKGVILKPDSELNYYDMLLVSREACNTGKFEKGFKLDDHLKALNLSTKTGWGGDAPRLYQEGKLGELIDYAINDVKVETQLFNHICKHGKLACLYKSEAYSVRMPVIPE